MDVGQNHHSLRRSWELWDLSLFCVASPRLGLMARLCLSLSFLHDVDFFSHFLIFSFSQRVRVSQLVSGFLSEWISLSVAVGFVSVKGVSSGASYVTMFTAASEMPKFIPFHPTIHHTSANSCPHSKKGGGSDHCSRRVGGNKPLGQVRGSKRGSWPQSWIIKFNKILKAF